MDVLTLYLKVGAGEKWPITIALTLLAIASFYGLFIYTLHVPFPEGQLFLWIGWFPIEIVGSLLY